MKAYLVRTITDADLVGIFTDAQLVDQCTVGNAEDTHRAALAQHRCLCKGDVQRRIDGYIGGPRGGREPPLRRAGRHIVGVAMQRQRHAQEDGQKQPHGHLPATLTGQFSGPSGKGTKRFAQSNTRASGALSWPLSLAKPVLTGGLPSTTTSFSASCSGCASS